MSASSGRIDAQGISHPDMDLKALAVLQLSIRQMLHQFALGGEYDGIFDGNVDVLGQHPVQTFELRSLLQRPRLVGPVLGYVFPEIERQMRTDAPMFLLLDDAAVTWLTPEQGARGTAGHPAEVGAAVSGLAHDDAQEERQPGVFDAQPEPGVQ